MKRFESIVLCFRTKIRVRNVVKMLVMYGTVEVTTLLCPVFKNRSSPGNCATFYGWCICVSKY